MTIDSNVAVDFEPEKMRAQEPDAAAARALFTELEFTTLVQDFLSESIELGETDYREAKTAADVEAVIAAREASPDAMLAIALESSAAAAIAAPPKTEEAEEVESEQLSLDRCTATAHAARSSVRVAISAEAGKALSLTLDDRETASAIEASAGG